MHRVRRRSATSSTAAGASRLPRTRPRARPPRTRGHRRRGRRRRDRRAPTACPARTGARTTNGGGASRPERAATIDIAHPHAPMSRTVTANATTFAVRTRSRRSRLFASRPPPVDDGEARRASTTNHTNVDGEHDVRTERGEAQRADDGGRLRRLVGVDGVGAGVDLEGWFLTPVEKSLRSIGGGPPTTEARGRRRFAVRILGRRSGRAGGRLAPGGCVGRQQRRAAMSLARLAPLAAGRAARRARTSSRTHRWYWRLRCDDVRPRQRRHPVQQPGALRSRPVPARRRDATARRRGARLTSGRDVPTAHRPTARWATAPDDLRPGAWSRRDLSVLGRRSGPAAAGRHLPGRARNGPPSRGRFAGGTGRRWTCLSVGTVRRQYRSKLWPVRAGVVEMRAATSVPRAGTTVRRAAATAGDGAPPGPITRSAARTTSPTGPAPRAAASSMLVRTRPHAFLGTSGSARPWT